jgi:hypothetical protein|tara:strand:+ start:733 stop:972 length:240 start_codon:yes stop_codon:yes gene_type:complete
MTNVKMMLDEDTLRPVIIAMTLYISIVVLVPRILKKPTGIRFVDDLVLTLLAQKDSAMHGTVITGLVVLLTNYIQDEFF